MLPIKIAFFSKELPSDRPNGVSVQVHRLANALCARGHELTCYSLSPVPRDARYGHHRLAWNVRSKLARKFFPAVAFSRQHCPDFDILHYHGDDYLSKGDRRRVRTFYGSALQEALHAKNPGRFMYQALFYFFELVSCMRSGTMVGISQTTCDALPLVKQHIPCGVPADIYRPGREKSYGPEILFIGDLGSRKRGSLLLRIFLEQIRPSYPGSTLVIVGPEPAHAEGVRYVGQLDEETLVRQFQRSWVYCMASSYEGFGVPAIEAMACGTAVVAVDNPGTRDIIENRHNGLLTSDRELGSALDTALADAGLRQQLAANGLVSVAKKYNIDIVAGLYEQIYRTAASA